MNITWNSNFSVSHKELDSQHMKLFEMLDQFHNQTLKDPDDKKSYQVLIKNMKDYASFHFKLEEEYMEKMKFPFLGIHKVKHNQFIEKINDYDYRLKNGTPILASELITFIKEWLTRHIYIEDKMYANHALKAENKK